MKHIVIIGNGISGVTAARHIRKKSNHRITIISAETRHFYSRTALMYVYMGHLKFEHTKPYEDTFWKKNRIELVYDQVISVETSSKRLTLQSGTTITYDTLVLATGSRPNKFNWPGQDLIGVQGLYSYQDLQHMNDNTAGIKQAVVVGGGLIGIEMVEMLLSRNIAVTLLVREPEFWSGVLPLQEAAMISRHIRSHQVNLKLGTELREVLSDRTGKVNSVLASDGEVIPCQFVGLTVGVSPQVSFLTGSGIEIKKGILVNEYLETNVPDVYALGDCAERTYKLPGRKNIEQVWYTGRMMGEAVAQTICGRKTKYEPGPWFNSAKFFEIEYQTYGNVSATPADHEADFYWEHSSGLKAMHFVWNKTSLQFLGINTFGIRLRHECFDQWLRQGKDIRYVIEHLADANFDPEFFRRHEPEITSAIGQKFSFLKSLIPA